MLDEICSKVIVTVEVREIIWIVGYKWLWFIELSIADKAWARFRNFWNLQLTFIVIAMLELCFLTYNFKLLFCIFVLMIDEFW